MDAYLSDMLALDTTVPNAWRELLESIRDFDQQYHKIGRDKDFEDHQPLLKLHDKILELSESLLEVERTKDLGGVQDKSIFVQALIMTTRFELATLFDRPVLDTYGSRTLRHFRVDWRGQQNDVEKIRHFATEVLGLTEEDLEKVDKDIERRLRDAGQKARVVEAVCDAFELEDDNPNLRRAIKNVTHFLYPDCNLEADELDIIIVGTAIFICIPFKKTELDSARFRRLTLEEQEPIRAFLRKVNRFRPSQFMNFPVFGFLTGEELDPDWVKDLAEMAQVDELTIRAELSRSVAILPMADVDKFLVHDVWGHVWQSAMLDFEEMYQELGKYADHLTLLEEVQHSYAKGLKLVDCLETVTGSSSGTQFQFNQEQLERFIIGEVLERIPVSFSAIVAEMFADVIEYKFRVQNPARAHHMPNSSYFKDFPTKLDLLIEDLDLYFEQATRVFSELKTNKRAQNQLIAEMQTKSIEHDNAEKLVEQISATWEKLSLSSLKSDYEWQEQNGGLKVNLYTRLALSFVSLHKSVVKITEDMTRQQLQTPLFRGFLDQMLLAASLSFEFDRTKMLWHIDEYLESTFWRQLEQYIAFENSAS